MFNSLRIRLLVIILLLAIIPQLVVTTIVGQRSFTTLQNQAVVFQRQVAANVSSDIIAYVQEHESMLKILEEVNGLGTLDTEAQQTILKNLLDSQRVFQELILVDRAGQEQIYLSRTDVVFDNQLISRANNVEFLDPVRSGETYFGPVRFDDVLREPLMTISIPLFDRRQGEVAAVLIANLRFKPVWDLLASMELPNDGDAYVLNQDGQVIAHRSPDIVLRGQTVHLMTQEGQGMGLAETDVFFASQVLVFGEQELLVIAEQPAPNALELAVTNARVALIIVLLSIVAAIALSVLAVRQIVNPVEHLAEMARAIEDGDYSVDVKISGRGEISDLIRAFSAMKAELQSVVSSLQEEVIERKKAEAALRTTNERLRELDQMKSKFIADISHELRTPITNISLYIDLLAQSKPESRTKYEVVLKKESSRLVELLDSILDMLHLQTNLEQAKLESIDLNTLVAEIVVDCEQMAIIRDLELSFTPSEQAIQVWGGAGHLKQVVVNLLKNALLYTPSGYIHLRTHQTSQDDLICLTIKDSGMGLDEEEITYCFERFYRGKRVGQYNIAPGVGLGLAKVKEIVEYHKGWVEVESEIDQGSTFSVYLKAHKSKDEKTNHLNDEMRIHKRNLWRYLWIIRV